jgi:hypothetical protein
MQMNKTGFLSHSIWKLKTDQRLNITPVVIKLPREDIEDILYDIFWALSFLIWA